MLNNRNRFPSKHRNRHYKHATDVSNNCLFTNDNVDIVENRHNNLLQSSNSKKMRKIFTFNDDVTLDANLIINNKTDIKPSTGCNAMTNIPIRNPTIKSNKLITCLDNNSTNKNVDGKEPYKIDREKTDLLIQTLLKQFNTDFFDKYNSPLFSGSPTIPLQLTYDTPPMVNEEIKTIVKEQVFIDVPIENLLDLIHLCDKYPLADNIEYNINMKALHNIKPSLLELQEMIGMRSIKENVVDQILYFIQDLHNVSPNNADYMHAVIYGPPGTGKTEVAKIMGKLFSKLGILKNNVFKKVTREDLVAGFLGQTAIKTKDVIKECLGGVLFIDEAYALGNKEKRDSFSKESIDTICEALSDHKKDLMCIIAGYEQELKDCFFSYNPGLESRFTWKFRIDDYTPIELMQIFEKKIKDCGWHLKEPLENAWFEKNKAYFKYYGRDMETLFSKVKIVHSRRVFCLPKEEKTYITMKDLEKGFDIYKKMGDNETRIKEQDRLNQLYSTIYC